MVRYSSVCFSSIINSHSQLMCISPFHKKATYECKGYFHSTMLVQALRKGFLRVKKKSERAGRGFPPVACIFFSFSRCFLFSSSSFMMNEARAGTPPESISKKCLVVKLVTKTPTLQSFGLLDFHVRPSRFLHLLCPVRTLPLALEMPLLTP